MTVPGSTVEHTSSTSHFAKKQLIIYDFSLKIAFQKKQKKPYKILIETNGAIKPVTLPMVMWLDGWGPLIVSHHPAKFYGHKHCGAGGMFLIVEKHDSTCLFKSSNIVYH